MSWSDLHNEVLEEFGTHLQSYDGGNVWLEQAEAARQYERSREGKFASVVAAQVAAGRCRHYGCKSPPEPGKVRCATHREEHRLGHKYDPEIEAVKRAARYDPAVQAARRKKIADEKRAAKICLDCTADAETNKTLCTVHLASRALNSKKYYQRRSQRERAAEANR